MLAGGVMLAGLCVAMLGAPALADDAPLVLSGNDIGLTGEELDARTAAEKVVEAPEPVAPAPDEPLQLTLDEEPKPVAEKKEEPSEWASEDEAAAERECAAAARPTAAEVTNFEYCVESAIRGGNGYDESSRVCRSLFPES
jgi:hypothetical protein